MSGIFETLSGAKGLRAEGRSAQNIANYNAAVAEQQATAERQRAAFGQRRQAKRGAEIKSAQIAALGAAGGLGSPVAGDLAAEQAAELELENLLIGFEGETKAKQLESQATLDILQGKLSRQKGKSAARRANIDFGMQIASVVFLSGFKSKTAPGVRAPSTATGGFSRVTPSGNRFA